MVATTKERSCLKSVLIMMRVNSSQLMLGALAMTMIVLFFLRDGMFPSSSLDRSASYNVKVLPAHMGEEQLDALSQSSFSYLAMIDAGSSGCRVHVYRYGKLGSLDGPLYILPRHVSMKVKPGLSTFASHPADAGKSLEGLVDFLKKNVPEESWKSTPIWLKATAGLRLLKESESKAILASVQEYLTHNSPFIFRPSYAKVISGKEEGAFGWVAYNYLKKIIGPRKDAAASGSTPDQMQLVTTPAKTATSPTPYPYTVVEMGGASSQVTQRVPNSHFSSSSNGGIDVHRNEHYHSIEIEKEKFHLYTYSYLGYGSEQAREKLNKYLLATKAGAEGAVGVNSASGVVSDPCLNTAYVRAKGKARESVYEGVEPTEYEMRGVASSTPSAATAKGSLCFDTLKKFLNNDPTYNDPSRSSSGAPRKCKTKNGIATDLPHSFDCVHQPRFVIDSLNFLVFENFFYTTSAANVLAANHAPNELSSTTPAKIKFPLVTSPLELKEAALEVCSMPFDDAFLAKYPRDGQSKDVATKLCFSLSYTAAFLIHGLHIPEDKLITVQKEVSGDEIEWALGAAYKEASDFLKKTYLKPT